MRARIVAVLPNTEAAILLHSIGVIGIDIFKLISAVHIKDKETVGHKIVVHKIKAGCKISGRLEMVDAVKEIRANGEAKRQEILDSVQKCSERLNNAVRSAATT